MNIITQLRFLVFLVGFLCGLSGVRTGIFFPALFGSIAVVLGIAAIRKPAYGNLAVWSVLLFAGTLVGLACLRFPG